MRSRVVRSSLRWWFPLLLAVAGLGGGTKAARGEGIVTTNSTTAFLQALGGGGRVQLSFLGTLTLEIPIVIASDTILEGVGPGGRTVSVSGGDAVRLFRVLPGIRFDVRNLVLRDGLSTNGAAILNEGILVASNVTFTACSAHGSHGATGANGEVRFGYGEDGDSGGPGIPAAGGAILNLGEATLVGCTFDGNEAVGGNGGAGGLGGAGGWRTGAGGDGGAGATAYGGAVSSPGPLYVTNCLFAGNSAQGGDGGTGGGGGTIAGSGQGGTGASAAGGAIHSTGFLVVARSAFATNVVLAGNSASGGSRLFNIGLDGPDGGTAWGGAVASWSTGQVVNATFYTNLVAGGNGGAGGSGTFTSGRAGDGGDARGAAIHARGQLDVNHVTFAWNSGTNGVAGGTVSTNSIDLRGGSNGRLAGSGISADSGARVSLLNSIVASPWVGTVDGSVTDTGYNLFTDGGPSSAGPGSIRNAAPGLSAYGIWEAMPPGLLPVSGSPAIDAADPARSPAVDQRGLPRPAGRGPDMGAMEVGASSFFLSGQVLDGTRGLSGVRIEVGSLWQLTDDGGRFSFGPLAAGFYTVALANGGIGFTPRLTQVALVADATNVVFRTAPLQLTFTRDPATGANRVSAAGQPSRVYQLEGGGELGLWQTLATGVADTQGRLSFDHDPGSATRWFYRVAAPPQ